MCTLQLSMYTTSSWACVYFWRRKCTLLHLIKMVAFTPSFAHFQFSWKVIQCHSWQGPSTIWKVLMWQCYIEQCDTLFWTFNLKCSIDECLISTHKELHSQIHLCLFVSFWIFFMPCYLEIGCMWLLALPCFAFLFSCLCSRESIFLKKKKKRILMKILFIIHNILILLVLIYFCTKCYI